MPFIISLSIIFVVNIIAIAVSLHSDSEEAAVGFGLINLIVGIVLFPMIYTASTIDIRTEQFKAEYESTKMVVETYHPYDYGNTSEITSKILEINEAIARNKARAKHPWFKVWYSEEVGNLEPISFKNSQKTE